MTNPKKTEFEATLPGVYFLDYSELADLGKYLTAGGRVQPGETVVAASRAGEGNMNCTVRVRTNQRTFILKQSRPWLEKYPQVAAPFDRTLMEGRFYQLVRDHAAVSGLMPELLWTDEPNRVIAFQDLGEASDFFPLYARATVLEPETLAALMGWLSALHSIPVDTISAESLRNRDMRTLNHEHIFVYPLRASNGLDLERFTPGLSAVAALLKEDYAYQQIVADVGERYLNGTGETILHGDFFPGSFLRTSKGVRVIDPEFCFCGDAEFDLGIFAAHLVLAGEPNTRAEEMLSLYHPSKSAGTEVHPQRICQYAGIEIMRRLLGIAQIPTLNADLERKKKLLAFSRRFVMEPERGF